MTDISTATAKKPSKPLVAYPTRSSTPATSSSPSTERPENDRSNNQQIVPSEDLFDGYSHLDDAYDDDDFKSGQPAAVRPENDRRENTNRSDEGRQLSRRERRLWRRLVSFNKMISGLESDALDPVDAEIETRFGSNIESMAELNRCGMRWDGPTDN